MLCIVGNFMNKENCRIIKEIYDDLNKEYAEQSALLDNKRSRILEIDSYIESILNKEQNDLQVFLPRKVENVYHDVLKEKHDEKEKLIFECDEIEKLLHKEKSRLENLEQVISDDSFMLHVKQLSVLEIQEKERQRIARDLHDSSLQNLTHLVHKIELSSLYIDQDPIKAKLELATVEKNLRKVIEDIRNNIFDLRPMSFDDLGIKETIEKMLLMINQEQKFQIETDIEDIRPDISDSGRMIILLSIYRMIQECVQNSIKHSEGNKIKVSLKDKKASYEIIIQDNGVGFDVNEAVKKNNHFGLSDIKERVLLLNGQIEMNTQNGTFIRIDIPQVMED